MAKRKTTKQKSPPVLKNFPLFMEGCRQIALDNGCEYGPQAHELNPDAQVLAYTDAIVFIEAVLKRLHGKTVAQFIPELPRKKFYEDVQLTDKVIEYVYLGFNDSCEIVLKKLGLKPHEIWIVEHVFNEFFEGELHQRFMRPKTKKGRFTVIDGSKREH